VDWWRFGSGSESQGLFSTKEQNNGLVQTQDVQRTDENEVTVDNSTDKSESVIPIDSSPDTSASSQSASAGCN
jgi:hypothetical protein